MKKIANTKLYEKVVHNIRAEVFGNLDQADQYKLPSERILAERNNVSIITVRKALNVLNEAGIVTSKSRSGTYVSKEVFDGKKTIAVIRGIRSASSMRSPWHSRLISQVEKRLLACGKKARSYTLFHGTDHIDQREMDRLVEDAKTLKFAGAILQPEFRFLEPGLEELFEKQKIPYLTFAPEPNDTTNFIGPNYFTMGVMGAEQLFKMGCKRVGIISNKPSSYIGPQEDFYGFQFAVANNPELETCDEWIQTVNATVADGINAFRAIWNGSSVPDGLLVSDEICFHGVVMAMLEKKVRYPDDLQIVVQRTEGSEHENIFNPSALVFSLEEEVKLVTERLGMMIRDGICSVPAMKYSPVLWEPEVGVNTSNTSTKSEMQTA